MRKNKRILVSVISFILSVPAFFAVWVGFVLTYLFAMFGGYQGTLLDAFISIVSKKEGLIIAIPVILAILHIIVFCYMLLRFARGQALSIAPQVYCLAIVIMAVIEKVRLILVSDNAAFFWFGLFSVPHVICLFLIIVLNRNESRKNGAQLTGSANLLREGLTH